MAGLLLKSICSFPASVRERKRIKQRHSSHFMNLLKVQVCSKGMIFMLEWTHLFNQPSLQPRYINAVGESKKMVQQRKRT